MLFEERAGPHQRAARTEPGNEVRDTGRIANDLWSGALEMSTRVGVVCVLVWEVPLRMFSSERFGSSNCTI